ncbi:hypothetical protein CKM354_000791500 [Cercospora kikuchii]|uniref:Methyltransferase type 11 domain-containing protein n=1 Tax=Cercospora kikuchii TaxID=84275 RepID=A0A9P3CHY0_9PEZI|nr:uncharacterized protein CKM354_000791500 [Cercospora kikuchii]GIZ44724.1 hypothetical protein CKM354_000791500 [Cercospora kikuchii]
MASTPESITNALAPSRQAFYQSIWQEHFPKLNLNGSSKISVSDIEMAETLLSWLKDSSHDLPKSISIPSSPTNIASSPTSPTQQPFPSKTLDPTLAKIANITLLDETQFIPDDSLTHAFAHINIYHHTLTLPLLKQIFYSLIPKGIAVITITKHNPLASILSSILSTSSRRNSTSSFDEGYISTEQDIRDMAEKAGFEVGKIRISERRIEVKGKEELKRLRGEMERILDMAVGQRGDAQSWERGFDGVWEKEVGKNGGAGTEGERSLGVECWVLVAMKWDLLCA